MPRVHDQKHRQPTMCYITRYDFTQCSDICTEFRVRCLSESFHREFKICCDCQHGNPVIVPGKCLLHSRIAVNQASISNNAPQQTADLIARGGDNERVPPVRTPENNFSSPPSESIELSRSDIRTASSCRPPHAGQLYIHQGSPNQLGQTQSWNWQDWSASDQPTQHDEEFPPMGTFENETSSQGSDPERELTSDRPSREYRNRRYVSNIEIAISFRVNV